MSPLHAALIAVLCACAGALAAEVEAGAEMQSLEWQTGTVTVGGSGGKATIALPAGWRYLHGRGARHVLEQMWGNPPDESVLGMAFPPPTGKEADDGWAVVVTYVGDGHVEDDDAADLDYGELLEEMQADASAANDARRQAGYPTVELLGWAEPPHYDAAAHKLYYAKDLRFGGETERTLNYCVRVLGREGYLELNSVATVPQLPVVQQGSQTLLGVTEFTAGNRYEDFRPGYDKVAAYGIGGLIAGKLLAKAGFFVLLLKFIKPILIGVFIAGGFLWKFLAGRKPRPQDETPPAAGPSAA